MTDHGNTQTTLVLGGTGKTGRRVAERLAAMQVPIRIGSRSAEPPFDWDDRATWAPVLQGVEAAYITYYPDLAFPGAAEKVGSFARLAVESGVSRLVLLSGRGEEGAEAGERAVRDSGAEWTIVRASWFAQNFSENFFLDAVLRGEIALPAGSVAEPFVDVDDIADIVVAALTEDGHAGQLYEVTGPRLLTFSDVAAEIGAAAGRSVTFQPVSAEEFAAGLVAEGFPAEDAGALADLFAEVLDGRNAHLTDGVQRALGRPPRDFAAYAQDAAATGVWDVGRRTGRVMVDGPVLTLTVACALGCGLVAGVFAAFSTFVMKALAALPPPEGIAAMQSINAAAPRSAFVALLMGTAAACMVLAVVAVVGLDEPGAVHRLAGSALYLAAIGMTGGYHVPRNNALAALDPNAAGAMADWTRYLAEWTTWNHMRTALSLAAAATLILSVRAG